MLVRCSTLCVAGALYLDWKGMPDEWLPFVVGGATILTIIDIVMEKEVL